jgi:hypothetical protein
MHFFCHRRVLLDRKRLNWRSPSEHDEEMLAFVERSIKLRGFLLYMLGGPPLHRKAGFDPNQPRVPAGNSGGGQWTDGGAGNPLKITVRPLSADGGSLEPAPQIPDVEPFSSQILNTIIKEVARWLAKAAVRETVGGPVGTFLNVLEAAEWIHRSYPYIQSYLDTPRTLGELQDAVLDPKKGYDIHHIVEKTPAAQAGFSDDLINGQGNLVRIPTLKHWEITGWYMRASDEFGGMSPREYLRSKSWEERQRVGYIALRAAGVLKP